MRAAAEAYSAVLGPLTEKQEKAAQDGVPTAQVVTVPGAHHYVFLSNEANVLREMGAFLASLHCSSYCNKCRSRRWRQRQACNLSSRAGRKRSRKLRPDRVSEGGTWRAERCRQILRVEDRYQRRRSSCPLPQRGRRLCRLWALASRILEHHLQICRPRSRRCGASS